MIKQETTAQMLINYTVTVQHLYLIWIRTIYKVKYPN